MIKTIKTMSKQEKGALYRPPEGAGCDPRPPYLAGRHFFDRQPLLSKTYRFSRTSTTWSQPGDKESMFLTYSELLNSLDSGAG